MWNYSPDVISSGWQEVVPELLAKAGFAGPYSVEPLSGGGNNRVYRVETNNKSLLLKAYFQHPEDLRERLGAEFAFSTFAWSHGVRSLPQPLASDPQQQLGIYQYIEGRKLLPHEISAATVGEALEFFDEINQHKYLPAAQHLSLASEACFSLAEHLNCIQQRIQGLSRLKDPSTIGRDATRFVRNDLSKAWRDVTAAVVKRSRRRGPRMDIEIPRGDRCLSPSDFGFHNALLAGDGRLRFIDFEYAGWDDPAKMVCDFFWQPGIPVPLHFFDLVVQRVAQFFSDAALPARIGLLLPVYQVKWCCILLNDFLPLGRRRRSFAGGTAAQQEQRARQLQKARQALQNLVSPALTRSA